MDGMSSRQYQSLGFGSWSTQRERLLIGVMSCHVMIKLAGRNMLLSDGPRLAVASKDVLRYFRRRVLLHDLDLAPATEANFDRVIKILIL